MSCDCAIELAVGNSNVVQLSGLKNAATGAYDNAAACSVVLYDAGGDEVDGQVWPAVMAYVPSSNGVYRATLSAALAIVEGHVYRAVITAAGAGGVVGAWEAEVLAYTRGCA